MHVAGLSEYNVKKLFESSKVNDILQGALAGLSPN